jgi:hypothetical protein
MKRLTSVHFYGTAALDGSPNFFALDNLVVEPVPDSSSALILLSAGLTSVSMFGRRKLRQGRFSGVAPSSRS